MTVSVQGNCNEQSCEGCPDVRVQRLCLAYNKCALVNCVGTPVHQRKPLCGVGAVLRHSGQMALSATSAAWTVFAEMVGLMLDLNLLTLHEAELLWPEDAFLCHVCAAKDASAEFFSILTSILNSALQLGGADMGYLYGGASNVDRNADAVLTISSTALNAFMHQLALAPLFAMIAGHQVMLCQTVGTLARFDAGDSFRIRLLPADQSTDSDAVAGQCLTLGATVLAMYPTDDAKSLGAIVASTMANSVQLLLIQQIEPLLHFMDTSLAYVIGAMQSFGVLVMTQHMAQCNPPDFSAAQVVQCACGDQPLGIQAARRAEGVQAFAHWCTGVISMLDGAGQPMLVYNPYTYQEVQAKAAGMQAYLDCLGRSSGGYSCSPPSDPVFSGQGVNALNVLVACRENYVKRRWDPAAFVLYNRLPGYPLRYNGVVPVPPRDEPCYVRDCMRDETYAVGTLAKACLERYLRCAGLTDDAYWQYEHATGAGPEHVDACLVFYGPAQAGLAAFGACVDGPDEGNCTLPGHCWTPRSPNNIPVCEQHRVLSTGARRDGLVQRLYAEAERTVRQAVQVSRAYQLGNQSRASAQFFSTEGDLIHQTMDCIFLGPYSRVDYWPMPVCAPGEECLAGPYWSRDEGGPGGVPGRDGAALHVREPLAAGGDALLHRGLPAPAPEPEQQHAAARDPARVPGRHRGGLERHQPVRVPVRGGRAVAGVLREGWAAPAAGAEQDLHVDPHQGRARGAGPGLRDHLRGGRGRHHAVAPVPGRGAGRVQRGLRLEGLAAGGGRGPPEPGRALDELHQGRGHDAHAVREQRALGHVPRRAEAGPVHAAPERHWPEIRRAGL
jgi:hypothetical protein